MCPSAPQQLFSSFRTCAGTWRKVAFKEEAPQPLQILSKESGALFYHLSAASSETSGVQDVEVGSYKLAGTVLECNGRVVSHL